MLDFRLPIKKTHEREIRRMKKEGVPEQKNVVEQIGCFWSPDILHPKRKERLVDLLPHFTKERLDKIIIPIVSGQSTISLRALHWLVINFAKKNKITLVMKNKYVLNIYNDFRSRLRQWSRDGFDAFRRGPRLFIEHNNLMYATTIAQLNYLYWCEVTGILDYMKENLKIIEDDLVQAFVKSRKRKAELIAQGITKTRCELSETPQTKCHILNEPLNFDFEKSSVYQI